MSTIDATLLMMEAMPEDARMQVMHFAQGIFSAQKQLSPFVPKSSDEILADLELSHQQIEDGKGMLAEDAMKELGKRHGFI